MNRGLILPIASIMALAIFVVDGFTPLKGAIGVLQIAVILLLAQLGRRAVLIGGGVCALLTVASYLIGHGIDSWDGALSRLAVSLIAQGVTVALSLRDRSTRITLDEQARILELSHDTVIIRDQFDRIIHWNDGAHALYGWSREEAVGRLCDDLLQSQVPMQSLQSALERDGQWTGKMERTCRDGSRLTLTSRWLQRTDPDGKPIGIMESSADLTEQIRIEAERAASERRFREIFESAGFAMWEADWSAAISALVEAIPPLVPRREWLLAHADEVLDACASMRIVRANQAAADLFDAGTPAHIECGSICAPEGVAGMAHILAGLANGETRIESETRLQSLDGRGIDAVLRVTLLPEGERWTHVLIMAFDVTERNRARAQLEQFSSELAHAAAVATLGQMAASIVHEVNQPLTAIINYGNSTRRWLNQQVPDMDEVRQCVERIIASGERAAAVIRRVRDMARKTPTQPEVLDVHELSAQALALIDNEAQRAGVGLSLALPPILPPVMGDRVQIHQVLVNLAMNAIQATRGRGNGQVVIEAALGDGPMLAMRVRDNGPGLPAEDVDRLFSPFFSTKAEGMGIGLSICRSLVEAQGGAISVAANHPHGACFTFTLPLADDGRPDEAHLQEAGKR